EPEHREALESGSFDDGLEVPDVRLERDLGHLTVREARAALVEAEHRIALRQVVDPRPHRGVGPVVLEVREPVRRPHQRRALAGDGVRQPHAVAGSAEADLLVHRVPPLAVVVLVGTCSSVHQPLARDLSACRIPSDTDRPSGSCFTASWASLSLYPSPSSALITSLAAGFSRFTASPDKPSAPRLPFRSRSSRPAGFFPIPRTFPSRPDSFPATPSAHRAP